MEELTRLQTATVSGAGARTRAMTEAEIRALLTEALDAADLAGRRVLVIIPDSTRTAPIALMSAILSEILEAKVEALDYLVALGTHPAMDDAALSRLLGREVKGGRVGDSRVFNHRWDLPETFVTLGTISASEVAAATGGRLEMDVPVRLNLSEAGMQSAIDELRAVLGPLHATLQSIPDTPGEILNPQ